MHFWQIQWINKTIRTEIKIAYRARLKNKVQHHLFLFSHLHAATNYTFHPQLQCIPPPSSFSALYPVISNPMPLTPLPRNLVPLTPQSMLTPENLVMPILMPPLIVPNPQPMQSDFLFWFHRYQICWTFLCRCRSPILLSKQSKSDVKAIWLQ